MHLYSVEYKSICFYILRRKWLIKNKNKTRKKNQTNRNHFTVKITKLKTCQRWSQKKNVEILIYLVVVSSARLFSFINIDTKKENKRNLQEKINMPVFLSSTYTHRHRRDSIAKYTLKIHRKTLMVLEKTFCVFVFLVFSFHLIYIPNS